MRKVQNTRPLKDTAAREIISKVEACMDFFFVRDNGSLGEGYISINVKRLHTHTKKKKVKEEKVVEENQNWRKDEAKEGNYGRKLSG